MDQTPRLRSAYPQTPATTAKRAPPQYGGSPTSRSRRSAPLPSAPTIAPISPQPPSDPVIPEHILDAPTQRLFVVSAAIALWSWRLWDWSMLNESEEQSLWLFMKWVMVDGVFLFGLPGLRIPWLEWQPSTMTILFAMHAVADAMLMFRIPLPVGAVLAGLWRSVWGAYELAVNEHNVNPETILFNESLILGRQIIHILPEGSAELNPGKQAFCIDQTRTEVRLPIRINATNPISMDLLRTDLDTRQNETIHISKSNIKAMHKAASRLMSNSDKPNEPKTLYYTVKKPGLYVLAKVMDESNLEVSRKRLAHTVVVPCPQAAVKAAKTDRCKGELSELQMEVIGTPPLTLKYRKIVNHASQDATFENILPEDFHSPMSQQNQNALVLPNKINTEWARSQRVVVPLGESLDRAGHWVYTIDEVRDAFGNRVSYSSKEHQQQGQSQSKSPHLHQVITVHERPIVSLKDCTPQQPKKVAKGASARLPVQYGSTKPGELANTTYHLRYIYSPPGAISETGDHLAAVQQKPFERKLPEQQPEISQAGLYTITGVSTDHCSGEVLEPASCLLQNPPEPSLSLSSTELSDKCAGRPIGLSVDLDLIGTPPFKIQYRLHRKGERHHQNEVYYVNGLRGQLELTPQQAGHWTYDFLSISDAVYKDHQIKGVRLEQDVKPSANARFVDNQKKISCIEDAISFDVQLSGEGPFTIEYELVHSGKRKKYTLENIDQDRVQITTEPLRNGGDYTLALTSVTDAMQCKEFLKDEAKITVRHQKPKVGFRSVDGHRSFSTVEKKSVSLPLRLEGDGPWAVKYRDQDGHEHVVAAQSANERITVSKAGIYELLDVRDATCPGVVDESANTFEVNWVPRPEMRIAPSDDIRQEGNILVKSEVCEGDDDALEVLIKGAAPYLLGYTQSVKLATKGSMADQNKEIRASTNIANLRIDTKMAGTHEYRFNKLSDSNYDHDPRHFTPLTVRQLVNARPSVAFQAPHSTYGFCSTESDGEQEIPIKLHGAPPFNLEFEFKHHGTGRPETVFLNNIETHDYKLRIPHSRLQIGKSSLHLRRISDAKGCIRSLDSTTPGVQISVHDAPTITELETKSDFCPGEHITYALSGVAPFTIHYTFEKVSRKATVHSTTFRRLAEKPGTFTIIGLSDSASTCQSRVNITKIIHPLPSARISQGKEVYVDIHEGGSTELVFDFGGTPPFEFTYTRSENTDKGAKKRGTVLDVRSEVAEEFRRRVVVGEGGTYEVVSVRDRWCGYARPGMDAGGEKGRKRIGYL